MPDTSPTPADQLRAAAWVDGDPLMEAMAAAVYEQCEQHPEVSVTIDDPRNIAAVAATVARQLLGTSTGEDTAAAPPAPTDRAAVIREAADRIQRRATQLDAVWLRADQVIDALHRIADEKAEEDAAAGVQPPTSEAHPEGCTCGPHQLARIATPPAAPADGTRCTCGGRFPTFHLHADTHEPAAPAAPEEPAR